jgi:multidrug efflux pump subunit AcrA (membrane-fusion protein)
MRRPVFAVLLILVLAAAACSTSQPSVGAPAAQNAAPTSTPIPTAPAVAQPTYLVQRGDVQDILEFSGRWQSRDQLSLAFEVAGAVRRVNVKRGDTVTAGELLSDLQITDLENQLASAQLNLESAQTSLQQGSTTTVSLSDAEVGLANARLSLDKTKEGSPWTNLVSARIGLQNAQNALDNAQRAYDDAISHPEQPASAADNAYQALQSAKLNLKTAQNNYDSAAQNFANYQYGIKQAENAVIQAELTLQQAQQGGGDVSKIEAVRSAQLSVDQIKAKIANSSLYSPINGVVLEVTIKPGDNVDAFKGVITVGQLEPHEAVASLAINDAQRLSVGVVGVCEVVNHPETAVQCIVRRVPLNAQDADQTTRVAASLDNVADGQLIDIQMPLQVSHNVLWLPPAAVRTFQNRTFVVLQTPSGPRTVDVTLGLQTTDRVEIKTGVNEGDVVIGP